MSADYQFVWLAGMIFLAAGLNAMGDHGVKTTIALGILLVIIGCLMKVLSP